MQPILQRVAVKCRFETVVFIVELRKQEAFARKRGDLNEFIKQL